MKYTTNLNLKKPDYSDQVDIEDINYNMDIIDSKVGNLSGLTTTIKTSIVNAINSIVIALANKVDKEAGKGLSTNDYTTIEKNKLAGIEAGANKYVHPGSGTNPHGTTKADVGLGNVDNLKQMPIAGGTFTGPAYAQANTSYTTAQLRNIILSTADASGTAPNGAIWIKYKP